MESTVQHLFSASQQLRACGLRGQHFSMTSAATDNSKAIGQRIKEWLKDHPGDRAKIMALCNVSRQAVTNWIRTGTIRKENLVKVAEITGMPESYWITGEIPQSDPMGMSERKLLAAWTVLTGPQKQEVMSFIDKKLAERQMWIQQLQSQGAIVSTLLNMAPISKERAASLIPPAPQEPEEAPTRHPRRTRSK